MSNPFGLTDEEMLIARRAVAVHARIAQLEEQLAAAVGQHAECDVVLEEAIDHANSWRNNYFEAMRKLEAIKQFALHHSGCKASYVFVSEPTLDAKVICDCPCTCGLFEALGRSQPERKACPPHDFHRTSTTPGGTWVMTCSRPGCDAEKLIGK